MSNLLDYSLPQAGIQQDKLGSDAGLVLENR